VSDGQWRTEGITVTSDDVRFVIPEGTQPPSDIPPQIFTAVAAGYADGERLDMRQLARRLGVSRATLYRHGGNRDQLLGAVIWWLGRQAIAAAVDATTGSSGVTRAVAVARRVLEDIDASTSLRRFLEAEPEAAMHILTGVQAGVQAHYVDTFTRLLELETSRGHLSITALDLASVSYALIRISEGFLYADVIAARDRDVARAVTLIEGLLSGLDSTARPNSIVPSS